MEIFGIGASELMFILLIAIIVLGPKDMQKAGRTIGRLLNQLVRSDSWKIFQRTSAEIRNLPRNLMREANLEAAELERDLRHAIDPRLDPNARPGIGRAPSSPSRTDPTPSSAGEDSPATQTSIEDDSDKI